MYRAGDMASVAILKNYSDEDLSSRDKAKQALVVVQMAFSFPHLIETCSDGHPRFTALLLGRLLELNKGNGLAVEIEDTRAFVKQRSR